jgi:hypothetical protein
MVAAQSLVDISRRPSHANSPTKPGLQSTSTHLERGNRPSRARGAGKTTLATCCSESSSPAGTGAALERSDRI